MLKIVRQAEFTTTPWKNGGGITREALRQGTSGDPSGLTEFRWRVSVAHIDASGPFSDFAGYRRTLVLLQGAGVRLSFSDRSVTELRAVGDLVTFDGALAADCQLLDGPCVDLNLMAAAGVTVTAVDVEPIVEECQLDDPDATTLLVFCVDGSVGIAEGDAAAVTLGKWDLAAASRGAAAHSAASDALRIRVAPQDPGTAATVFVARLLE